MVEKNDRQMYIVPKYPVSKDVDWNLPYEVNLECADFEILHSVSKGQSNGDEWNYKIMSCAFCRKSVNFPSPASSEIISKCLAYTIWLPFNILGSK